jgi:hypothetical protein
MRPRLHFGSRSTNAPIEAGLTQRDVANNVLVATANSFAVLPKLLGRSADGAEICRQR